MKLKRSEVVALVEECVEIAQKAWWKVMEHGWNDGDNNRASIGRIADTILQKRIDGELEIEDDSGVKK